MRSMPCMEEGCQFHVYKHRLATDPPLCKVHLERWHKLRAQAPQEPFRTREQDLPERPIDFGPTDLRVELAPKTTSQTILSQAQETISERGEQYGDANEVFDTTAAMFNAWNAVWSGDGEFGATGVAVFNICQKLARIAHGESDIDNWRDIIGYAALGAEIEE